METIRDQVEIKASKPHTCNFCSQKIAVGEMYYKSTHKHEGEIYDWKTHKSCDKIADELNMYDADNDCGVTEEIFVEIISEVHDDMLTSIIAEADKKKYSDIVQQLMKVQFKHKLNYVIRKLINK